MPDRSSLLAASWQLLGGIRRLSDEYSGMTAPQEALDLLLTLAGQKPAYVTRGTDDPQWRGIVIQVAERLGATALDAPQWSVDDAYAGAPAWVREATGGSWDSQIDHCLYVATAPESLALVGSLAERRGRITAAEEVALLGYPACCTTSHHRSTRLFRDIMLAAYRRHAGGDEGRMRELVAEDAAIQLTEEEQAGLAASTRLHIIPYSSISLCPACWRAQNTPARRQAAGHRQFAKSLNPSLCKLIETTHRRMLRRLT